MNHSSQNSPICPIISAAKPKTKPHGSQRTLSTTGSVGQNSQVSNLTLAERERFGGIEYRAVTFLAVIILMCFLLWQKVGSLGLGAYVARNWPNTTLENGLNP